MADSFKLKWDETGEKLYETGVDHGVLYLQKTNGSYDEGVEWNGLTGFTESPEGAEANPIYADNIKYLNLRGAEDYGCTITASSTDRARYGSMTSLRKPSTNIIHSTELNKHQFKRRGSTKGVSHGRRKDL